MRQFFTWRYWATIGTLFSLSFILWTCQSGSAPLVIVQDSNSRRVDLIAVTATIRSNLPWSVSDGASNGDATVVLVNGRVLNIANGTLGQSTCLYPEALNACVILADTLGDGIVWFSLVSAPELGSNELELPPIDELLDGVTYARLTNGWEIALLDKVVRRCAEETPNLTSFVQRFKDQHVTIVDLNRSEVSAVRCN